MKNNKYHLIKTVLNLFFTLFSIFAINANAGVLYATDGGSDFRTLYTINTASGSVTTIGSIGYSVSDIGWDKTTNTLYGVTRTRHGGSFEGLITINTQTGVGTEIGGTGSRILQMDIDSNGNIYGSEGGTIYHINKSTGITTD